MATSFKLQHDFPGISIEKFIAHLNDEKLNAMLADGLDFDERTLLSHKQTLGSVEWEFRVKKTGDLPAAIKKVLKADAFSWHERSRFVPSENCIYWEIIPEFSAIKFRGEGVWRLSSKNHGCSRVIEGKVTVDIPLVGKMVENFIVNELVKTYEIEPRIQEQFYAQV